MPHNTYYVEDLENGEFQIKSRKESHAAGSGHIAQFYDRLLADTVCELLNKCRYYPYNASGHAG